MALSFATKVKFVFALNVILFLSTLSIFMYVKHTTNSSFMHTNYLVKPLFQIALMIAIILGHYLRLVKTANIPPELVTGKDKKFLENAFVIVFLMAGFYCFMVVTSLVAK